MTRWPVVRGSRHYNGRARVCRLKAPIQVGEWILLIIQFRKDIGQCFARGQLPRHADLVPPKILPPGSLYADPGTKKNGEVERLSLSTTSNHFGKRVKPVHSLPNKVFERIGS